MKKIKEILSLLLSVVCLGCVFTGCKDSQAGNSDSSYVEQEAMLPESVAETGHYITKQGRSEYSIVIPETADSILMTAATELQSFYQKASGVFIPVVVDAGLTFNVENHYISLGNTTVFQGSGLEITADMKETGYVLKRFGNTVICNAKNSNGTLCGTYDMLNYTIDFECYASDEVYYVEKADIPLLDYDIRFIPTVDMREIKYKSLNSIYEKRMRLFTWMGKGHWISFAHTTITDFLPAGTYKALHPDWYNDAGTQVCYANDEMRAAMVEQIKNRIEGNPDGMYLMIGHEDNEDMCECNDCVAAREKFGGYAGQELDFTNKIAEEVDAWLATNYPERNIQYVFFAYTTSVQAPAEYNTETGKYEPVYEGFSVSNNVNVLYCPIASDFSQPFNSVTNASHYQGLKAWVDLFEGEGKGENIIIWTYSLPAHTYFAPINSFGVYGEHYKTMADMGVSYIMDQAVYDSGIPCFEALRIYTQSKMMYRSDYEYTELVENFHKHYYDLASEGMMDYYHFFRSYYKYLETEKGFSGAIFFNTTDQIYWPRNVVCQMLDILDNAIKQLEPLKTSDPERYEVIYARIKREKLTPIYLMFSYYMDALSQEEKEEFWYDMKTYTEQFGILGTRESSFDMETKLEQWRMQIFG